MRDTKVDSSRTEKRSTQRVYVGKKYLGNGVSETEKNMEAIIDVNLRGIGREDVLAEG